MPNQVPSFVAPTTRTWLGVAREAAAGTAVLPVATMPLDARSFSLEDTPKFLADEAVRGSMNRLFNEVIGVESATFSFGGPNFLDVHGFFLDNMFGDLATTGSAAGGGNSTLNGGVAAGVTSLVVVSGAGFATSQNVQIDAGSISETVTLTNVSGTTLTFAGFPLRFAHSGGATVKTVTGPYTHTFATLNTSFGQPPTHTMTDFTGLTPTVGARAYASSCLSQMDLTGNTEQLLDVKFTGTSWLSAPAASTPVNTVATAVPVPAWNSTVTIGGVQVYNVTEWALAIKRQLQVYWTAQGSQQPYIIARGPLDVTGTINFSVASDESDLNFMLNNTQPTLVIAVTNSLAGANVLTLTLNAQKAAFIKAKVDRSTVLVGYQAEFECVANTTNIGGSGGLGPATFSLINNYPQY